MLKDHALRRSGERRIPRSRSSRESSSNETRSCSIGKAYLIGAGPGDPRLITLRGVEALGECDLVLVDDLVHPDLLRHAKSADVVHVGKRGGHPSTPQERITRLLVEGVRRGDVVGRLKGGDPFVFGRGGEELAALVRAQLPFEIVPGVSSALGAAAYAGIPLTHRAHASSVAFIAAHTKDGRSPSADVKADTLVFFMCLRTIHEIARGLLREDRDPSTPVAIVRGATFDEQEVHLGTLGDVATLPNDWHQAFDPTLPTLAIVGEVASFAAELSWFGAAPSPIYLLRSSRHASGF